jgi:hypothetical protein
MEKANVRSDEDSTHWCAIGIYDILDPASLRASRPCHDFQPDCMVTAESDGISFDQFVALALAEKVAVLDAGTYLAERAERSDREKFQRILEKVPDVS